MGWGTTFKCEIVLNKVHYGNLDEVLSEIDYIEKINIKLEQQLLMFASSTPKDIISEECKEEPIAFINNSVMEVLELFKENNEMLFKLYLLKENFDKKEQW